MEYLTFNRDIMVPKGIFWNMGDIHTYPLISHLSIRSLEG